MYFGRKSQPARQTFPQGLLCTRLWNDQTPCEAGTFLGAHRDCPSQRAPGGGGLLSPSLAFIVKTSASKLKMLLCKMSASPHPG